MADNNLPIESKLSFMQKVKKSFLIRGISGEKYLEAEEIIKNQPDVIEALMSKSAYNIRFLSFENGLAYLQQHPEVIKACDAPARLKFLDANPTLFTHLDEAQQLQIIFFNKKYEFLKELPAEKQLEFLTKKTSTVISVDGNPYINQTGLRFDTRSNGFGGEHAIGTLETEPSFFATRLEMLDEGVVLKAIAKYSKDYDDRYKYSDDREKKENYYTAQRFFNSLKFESLPVSTQLKIALVDNRLIEKLSDEALVEFVGDNPLTLNLVPSNRLKPIIEANPKFVAMLDYDKRKAFSYSIPVEDYLPLRNRGLNYYTKQNVASYEEVMRIAAVNYDRFWDLSYITDSVRNTDLLWETAKSVPQALTVTGITDRFQCFRKLQHVRELFKTKLNNPAISEALERSPYFGDRFQYTVENAFANCAICQVLTDEKVLARCSQDKIIEFIQNPSMELLKDIVGQTYGEKAKQIMESRPGLTFENVPNLKIFDEAIFENFGESMVHNMLTYDSKFAILLADMATHPERIAEYKKFEKLTEGMFQENAAGTEVKYKAFVDLMPLISKIDEKEMTEERKLALKIAISDLGNTETRFIPLEKMEDLDTYIEKRNKMYDEAMLRVTDIKDVRDILSRRLFGVPFESDMDAYFRASRASLSGIIRFYSVDNLLKDKRTRESGLFSEDELDMLELAKIISEIKDPKVLQEVYGALKDREDVLGPVDFEKIKQKIPIQYSRELVSQLMTPEKAREMVERGEEGIDIRSEDDIEIISLHGADFKMLMHTMIGITGGATNSGLNIPRGKTPAENWKEFEMGCSTISSCLIESGMLKSCGDDASFLYNLGFCSIDPRQIVGMSHHDSHVSHAVGNPDPYFEYHSVKMNYPEELIRKTAAQISGVEAKDQSHEYNEIAFYRREQDPSKVTSENYGGKIMPDYIIVYGKASQAHKELARAFARDGKPIPILEIDRDAYNKSLFMRAYEKDEEHTAEPKGDSEVVGTVKKITEGPDNEER